MSVTITLPDVHDPFPLNRQGIDDLREAFEKRIQSIEEVRRLTRETPRPSRPLMHQGAYGMLIGAANTQAHKGKVARLARLAFTNTFDTHYEDKATADFYENGKITPGGLAFALDTLRGLLSEREVDAKARAWFKAKGVTV